MMIRNIDVYRDQKACLVVDELPAGLLASSFIKLLAPSQNYPSHLPGKWINKNDVTVEIPLLFTDYLYPDHTQVTLYCLPEATGHPLEAERFEAPVQTIGFLILIDIEICLHLGQKLPGRYSAITWTREYNLPVIAAAIHSQAIDGRVEQLSQFIDDSPGVQLLWCDGEMDADFAHRAMAAIYACIGRP